MLTLRKSKDRGGARHGWLDTKHTFSFASYYDPAHMGFRALRVINEDRVRAGAGFGRHPHRDMEIVSYVLDGALEHADSMGNGSVIRPGEIQRMTAGSGVTHSEYNHSKTEPVHFLQIWIEPSEPGLEPSYEQKAFAPEERAGVLRLIASNDGRDGSVVVHQDLALYSALLSDGDEIRHTIAPGRHLWVHVARGDAELNGIAVHGGDGAAVTDEARIVLRGTGDAEVLVFDLA